MKTSSTSLPIVVGGLGAVLLAVIGSQLASADALSMLLVSAAALLVTAAVWARRHGALSPVPLVALGLFLYFPFRGFLHVAVGVTTDQRINPYVLRALATTGPLPAALDTLAIGVVFAVVCEAMWRFGWIPNRPGGVSPGAGPEQTPNLAAWATPLLIAGAVAVLLQVPAQVGALQGDEVSGGFVVQLIYLMTFAFGIGLILAWMPGRRLPLAAWILLAIVAGLGFYMGRKETLFLPLVALMFAGASAAPAARRWGRLVFALLIGIVLVFLVFPAVTTYRREIMLGASTTGGLSGLPDELINKSAVTGEPRTDGVVGYAADCLLYLSNRTHGFDSLALAESASSDPQMLTAQSVLLSPLGLMVPSSYWATSQQQVGLYFGLEYWRSDPSNNVSIAPTIFAQARIAFGSLAIVPAAALIAVMAALAAKYFRSPSHAGRALGFVFMATALAFERDALYLIITTERRLAVLGIIIVLAAVAAQKQEIPLRWPVRGPLPAVADRRDRVSVPERQLRSVRSGR